MHFFYSNRQILESAYVPGHTIKAILKVNIKATE